MSQQAERYFATIRDHLCSEHDDVAPGKMMSREAITHDGKVFAFYREGMMVFKLGREFDADKYGLTAHSALAPFKNKAPMRDWLQVPATEQHHWDALSQLALEYLRTS